MSLRYQCNKCGNTQCDTAEFRGAGGFWSKIFDVQGQRYSTVTCTRCKYTEFYKVPTSMLGNVFDLFTN